MPFFKLKSKQAKSKPVEVANGAPSAPVRPRWQSTWTSAEVQPDEIEELIHAVTAEMKLRAEALDSPFLLLPFRPNSDHSSARSFVNTFFKSNASGSQQYRGASLQQELRLTSPTVLCSILKWSWSRMPKGVVSWPVYESFQLGEKEASMARNAFDTFIPLGSDSPSRTNIIVDFFSLLAAVAAHGKLNGLGGRKLSRLAGWWAFEHTDGGKGFEGGYKSWSNAADASSHLFFAYLRSLSPDMDPSMNVIERIPRSLQALLASTEYPPEAPTLLQRTTPRVVMIVDQVSPTPFSLLRRAKHFEYRQNDRVLREYSEFEDPVDALTDECKRVLYAIATTNSSGVARSRHGLAKPDETWSSFTSVGFGDLNAEPSVSSPRSNGSGPLDSVRTSAQGRPGDIDRPVTPSWGDFLSSGFQDEVSRGPSTMLLPPDKVLPPIGSRNQTPSIMSTGTDLEDDLAPGELAAITTVELDDAFWWVWMTSLAGEEPNTRKAVFGRCALIETSILNGKWLIMEEQVKGASPDPLEGAQVLEKKSRFSFSKRGRLGRGKSNSKKQAAPPVPAVPAHIPDSKANRMTIGPDQQAKIRAAAAAMSQKKTDQTASRRGRQEDPLSTKTNSTFTLGLQSEAGPAMKWANSYDNNNKDSIRAAYLGNNLAGTGQDLSTDNISRQYTNSVYLEEPETTQQSVVPEPSKSEEIPAPAPPLKDESQHHAPLSPVQEVPQPEYEPLQKELAVEPSNTEEHPALHKEESPIAETRPPPVKTQTQDTNPAILAAKLALEGRAVSPESTKSSKVKKQPSGGGLKKFFSRKEKNRRSMDVPQPQASAGALSAANDAVMSRQLQQAQNEPSSPKIARKPVETERAHEPAPPVMPVAHEQYNGSTAALSRVDSQEQRDADIAFSRFDQGPMEDMPAAVPKDSVEISHDEEVAEPPSVPRYNQQTVPAHYVPQAPASIEEEQTFSPAHERVASLDDTQSEATMEDHREVPSIASAAPDTSKDRWERIRENAARRAANARQSEDTSTLSRPTEGGRTDDGETSGEETIESRVARIKARVRELTGDMDSGATSSLRR